MKKLPQPARALKNPKHEAFCLAYAGPAWGNATAAIAASGFRVADRRAASVQGTRLLRRDDVRERVRHLREQAAELLGVDRLSILERRWAIAKSPDTFPGDVLTACRDLEKSLGLAAPERVAVDHQITGKVEHSITPDPRTLADLWSYIDEICKTPLPVLSAARAEQTRRLASEGRLLPTGDSRPTPAAAGAAPAAPLRPAALSPAAREQLRTTILAVPLAKGGATPS